MAKTLTIQIPDDLEQALTLQAQRLNKSPEDVVLELLSRQLPPLPQPQAEAQIEEDPLLKLLGSIHLVVYQTIVDESGFREMLSK